MAKGSRIAITEKVIIPGYSLYNGMIPKEITMRAMTTVEEKMRLAGTNADILGSIIKACIVEPEDFDVKILKLQDVQYLMYRLRAITYGADYHINVDCPVCGKTNEITVNLDEILVTLADENLVEPFEVTLPVSGDIIEFNILSSGDYANIKKDANRIKAKMPAYVGNPEFMLNYQYKIKKVNGEELIPAKIQQYVENLHARDARAFDIEYDKVANKFGMDTVLSHTCDGCGEDFIYALPMTSEFFRPTY